MTKFLIELFWAIVFWIIVWCVIHDIGYYFSKGWYKAKSKFNKNVIDINIR